MKSLIFKEVRSYLSSIIGFITIIVFLIITGTFLWLIPGNFNILNLGEASLIPFFKLTPYIYLILIPSFTMKLFAEEKRTGTIELLATKPLSDLQIVTAKFIFNASDANPNMINISINTTVIALAVAEKNPILL